MWAVWLAGFFCCARFSIGDTGTDGPPGRIAFAFVPTGDHELWVVNGDGTGLRQLTDEAPPDGGSIAWSPSGDALVFTAYDPKKYDLRDVYLIEPDGTGLMQLTKTPEWEYSVQFVSDNQIAFWSEDQWWVMDRDGTDLQALDLPLGPGAIAPDRQRILMTQGNRGLHAYSSSVLLGDLDAGVPHRLTDAYVFTDEPAWSGDGSAVAFICGDIEMYISFPDAPEQDPPGVCVSKANGSEPMQIAGYGSMPTISGDGDWVAYLGDEGLTVASAINSVEPRVIPCECLQILAPTWSPN